MLCFSQSQITKVWIQIGEDEYEKYNQMWDGQADQLLINTGATIIRSEIEITDSQGRNRKIVRRNK